MGTQQSCISPPATEPKNDAKANSQHASLSQVQNEKMGRKQSCVSPMGTKPNNAANQSQQVSDAERSNGRQFKVSQQTDGQVKNSRPIGRHMVVHTFDGKVNFLPNENDANDLDERSNDGSRSGYEDPRIYNPVTTTAKDLSGSRNKPVAKSSTSTFQATYPRPGHEDQRIDKPVSAWTEDLNGSRTKQASDQPNRDHKTSTKKTGKNKLQPMEIREADYRKTEKSNEINAASSSNNMKTFYEYERNATTLESSFSQFSAEKDELLNRKADDQKTEESNANHAVSSSNNMNIIHEYERKIQRLESRLSKVNAEKDELLNRLSEIGALKLTDHNPNVTDLNDQNRPQKVVEEFSELYDNEWTDAYEYLTKRRKEDKESSAKILLKVVQVAFNNCMSSTEKKTKALTKALVNYVGLTKEDHDDIELKDIQKRIRDYRRIKLQKNFKRTEEEVGDQLKRILTKENFDDLSEYIGSCVSICFKMCTKDPPMYLDFGDSKQPAQSSHKKTTKMTFDKAKFMSYTISGDYIDYVVWPAVYLCKDGTLMKKGVAQGIQDDKGYKDESYKPT